MLTLLMLLRYLCKYKYSVTICGLQLTMETLEEVFSRSLRDFRNMRS